MNTTENVQNRLISALDELKSAGDFLREDKIYRFLSQAEKHFQNAEAVEEIYQIMPDIIEAGVFAGSIWEKPQDLIPRLVGVR